MPYIVTYFKPFSNYGCLVIQVSSLQQKVGFSRNKTKTSCYIILVKTVHILFLNHIKPDGYLYALVGIQLFQLTLSESLRDKTAR